MWRDFFGMFIIDQYDTFATGALKGALVVLVLVAVFSVLVELMN